METLQQHIEQLKENVAGLSSNLVEFQREAQNELAGIQNALEGKASITDLEQLRQQLL